jgi:hypothetical protein
VTDRNTKDAFVPDVTRIGNFEVAMSARNGDRARFQKDRKRKLVNRQRSRELRRRLSASPVESEGRERKMDEHNESQVTR